ncbi:uncharacterized protein LOC113003168 [Solenopsis invicta]|uniref:uncharacterized protein LOC113003168 n=1 Tax=Solenopsis invicta TaxID=13686 RepID=UPI000E33E491|nr:uncharacterized protein LOC113003168 [Solenopsis invicta]
MYKPSWSDSTIVLNWIVSPSRKWSTFVANRISEIQGATNPSSWRHIRSPENPADILSRGLDPQELTSSSLWWHGPAFLKLGEESWPKSDFARAPEDMPEQKRCTTAIAVIEHSIVNELLNKFSNLNKACRVLAYCFRITRSFRPVAPTIFISHHETSTALEVMCKSVQEQAFSDEYKALLKGQVINPASRILSLSPFVDKDKLIRVDGRLGNSNLSSDMRHPILLPQNHILTQRIIERERAQCTRWRAGHDGRSKAALLANLSSIGYAKNIKKLRDVFQDEAGAFGSNHGLIARREHQTQVNINHFLRDQETAWKFIPPNAPHFGGLWEAAVKSAKHHLYRIAGKSPLTFEELQTTFCEIEVISSCPLTPLSDDPNDLSYLSPGHFLVGTALNSFPYTDVTDVSENRLGLAPLQWSIGRVEEVHPGPDNIVRIATVRTARGLFTRPLSKIAILPIEE